MYVPSFLMPFALSHRSSTKIVTPVNNNRTGAPSEADVDLNSNTATYSVHRADSSPRVILKQNTEL